MLAQLSGSSLEHENHAVLTALPALVPQTRRSEPRPRCSSRRGCEQNPGVLQAARAGNICSAGPPLGCGGGRKMLHKCSRGWGWRLGQGRGLLSGLGEPRGLLQPRAQPPSLAPALSRYRGAPPDPGGGCSTQLLASQTPLSSFPGRLNLDLIFLI